MALSVCQLKPLTPERDGFSACASCSIELLVMVCARCDRVAHALMAQTLVSQVVDLVRGNLTTRDLARVPCPQLIAIYEEAIEENRRRKN